MNRSNATAPIFLAPEVALHDPANTPRYAARLNAFRQGRGTVADMLARAGQVGGLTAADLNYPDHFDHHTPAQVSGLLADQGMVLNGLAMRYYTDPGFRLGAFTHPDAGRPARGD